jgi:hypothetical protein
MHSNTSPAFTVVIFRGKESPTLKSASAKAITVAAYFKNENNSYFISKLHDVQKEL